MKYLRKLIAFIFILPVVFIMVGCTGPQSTAPANPGQVEETLPDNSSESSSDNSSEVDNDEAVNDENGDDDNQPEITEPSDEAADDQKPAEPSQPEEPDSSQDDDDAETDPEDEADNENNDNPEQPAEPEAPTEPEAPEELPSQPEIENPSEPEVPNTPEETPSEPEPEIPSESEEPTDPDTPAEPETPEENAFYTVDFELLSYSMDPSVVTKYETPMSVMTLYPDIQIESNDGLLFFVDEFIYGGGQYAIHFKNDFEKEICTTEENGTQILEFDVHYQSYTPCAIMINGSLVAKLQSTTSGFETASFKIEISSDSTFTLDLTVIM